MATVIAIQPNGERLPVERWAYDAWAWGRLRDEMILRILERAVRFDFWGY